MTPEKKDPVTIDRGTKFTLGLIASAAVPLIALGSLTYTANARTNERLEEIKDSQAHSLSELRLEFRTGTTEIAAEVRHNTEQLRRITDRVEGFSALRDEIVELRHRVKTLEGK